MAHRGPWWLLALLLLMSGCSDDADATTGAILDEIGASHLGPLAWSITWRAVIGGLLGVFVGIGTFFVVRQVGGFRSSWAHAKWVRIATAIAYAGTFAGVGGWLGFWHGAVDGTREVVTEGQLGTDVLPKVGDAGSILLAAIYIGEAEPAALSAQLDEFATDGWRMEPDLLTERIASVPDRTATVASDQALAQVFARYPDLEGTIAESMIPWVLASLVSGLVDSAREAESTAFVTDTMADVFAGIDGAAGADGDSTTISHAELSEHLVATAAVPLVMRPIENFADSQKTAGWLTLLALIIVSIGGFQLAHWLHERRHAVTTRSSETETHR